ncbi:HrpE/YscL family type III secretion apparatus protein [Verrucomicrobium spinosum]|uniref:HrpE/YscL family type III secretion apparatus protein n=1 Tax=Verrucomicrobium spinosum TaxID=2736 RepID=UPI0001744A11|nr:HrpE/YscL family type III secretion apparatus protein [Verrucomicrobium spinosum]
MLCLNATGVAIEPSAKVVRAEDYAVIAGAKAIVDAAVSESIRLRKAGQVDADQKRAEAQAEYERRREEGFKEGQEEGKAEIAGQIMECMTQSAAYFSKVEGVMIDLVMRALRRVLGTFEQKEIVEQAVRHALETTRNEGHVTVRVAPAQAEWLQSRVQSMLESCPKVQFLEVLPDERLAEDGCVLETEIGVVDASIQTQLRAIEKALINSLK